MLLTISTTYYPASDISFLFHKHPSRIQEFEITGGKAHVFYPEATDQQCTIALLLDIDPVGLVRKDGGPAGPEFALEQYVNDRPYVASSLMSAAIAQAFSSALNGRSKDKPELTGVAMPLRARIAVLPVRGGETLLRHLFEPLGYTVQAQKHLLNEAVPAWGDSRYFTVTLEHTLTLQQLLTHLYVLIPVCDNDKHYWIGSGEVEKLLEKGRDWLATHPARELITLRYLKHQRRLAGEALEVLLKDEAGPQEEEEEAAAAVVVVQRGRAHTARLEAVKEVLLQSGARTVVDLGCGEGKLLKMLLAERGFDRILGMDINYHSLEIAKEKLKTDRLPPGQQERLQLIHGSLTYRDKRIEGYDGAALVEVIEHLDEPRLAALEKVVFRFAKPGTVVVTTPNAEYNIKLPNPSQSGMRHHDHRFEWTRSQFEQWGRRLGAQYGYRVSFHAVGEEDPEVGALSQMAVFRTEKRRNTVTGIIQAKLRRIEQENQVRILYACESGSRAWGFASSDSDYDVRFIYARQPDSYLSILDRKDFIEVPVDSVLDIHGWDIRKALRLLLTSNPPLYEWLQSPVVYQTEPGFLHDLKALMPDYFSLRAGCHHYQSMTRKIVEADLPAEQVRIKKYFYALRTALAALWIVRREALPPMQFQDLRELVTDAGWQQEVDNLLEVKKRSDEKTMTGAVALLHQWLQAAMEEISRKAAALPVLKPDADRLDKIFRKWIYRYDV